MHNASTIVAPKLGVSWYSARLMRLAGLLGEGRVDAPITKQYPGRFKACPHS